MSTGHARRLVLRRAFAIGGAAAGTAGLGAFALSMVGPFLGPGGMESLGRAGFEELLTAAAATAVLGCLVWLAAGALLTLISCLPALASLGLDRLAVVITPMTVRRLVAAMVGVALTTGPTASSASASSAPASASSASPGATGQGEAAASAPWPDLDRPAAPAWQRAPASPARGSRDSSSHRPDRPRPRPAGPPSPLVVRAGDSLWSIARRVLPAGAPSAEVAAEWPRWYAANARRVGPDPDLLRVGVTLTPPPPRSHEEQR